MSLSSRFQCVAPAGVAHSEFFAAETCQMLHLTLFRTARLLWTDFEMYLRVACRESTYGFLKACNESPTRLAKGSNGEEHLINDG
eukprot:scaffold850_cov20-Prasinocladus_malaysianus.AAC.1